jgi:hypothetical protein
MSNPFRKTKTPDRGESKSKFLTINLQVWFKAGKIFAAQAEVLHQELDIDVSGKYFKINLAP